MVNPVLSNHHEYLAAGHLKVEYRKMSLATIMSCYIFCYMNKL